MVARISIGSSIYGVLKYNGEKINRGKGKVLAVNKVFYPLESTLNISQCANVFYNQMPSHHNVQKPVIHISLNPHPKDKLTDTELMSIAQEYLDKLGYGNQPYIVFKHEDIQRSHIHIVSLRVNEQGQKIDDRFEHRRSDQIRRELEKKYGLTPAPKENQNEKFSLEKADPQKGNIKHQISNILKSVERYHFQSFNEYRSLLSLYNISVEEIRGTIHDKPYNGLVYSVIDKKGNKVSNPFKSSLFGKSVGYKAIWECCEKSKEVIKTERYREQTKKMVADLIRKPSNQKTFEQELKRQGIDVIFRKNDTDRIYGVTFIDHNNDCVFNGSHLGKEFSANSFQEYFSDSHSNNHQETDKPDEQLSNETTIETAASLSGLGGLFTMGGQGVNPEEEAFIHRMQRKKRKKGRRI